MNPPQNNDYFSVCYEKQALYCGEQTPRHHSIRPDRTTRGGNHTLNESVAMNRPNTTTETNPTYTPTVQSTSAQHPILSTLEQLIEQEPALTAGGVRHLLFTKGHDLPGVYRFGRKLLFNRQQFIAGIMSGHTAHIAGVQR